MILVIRPDYISFHLDVSDIENKENIILTNKIKPKDSLTYLTTEGLLTVFNICDGELFVHFFNADGIVSSKTVGLDEKFYYKINNKIISLPDKNIIHLEEN